MPVGPHRAPEGSSLTQDQAEENRAVVHRAWKLHYDHIQHSLVGGFYQGWDLHPAQFPTLRRRLRLLLESLDAASERLRILLKRQRKLRSSATSLTMPQPGRVCSTIFCARSIAER